MKIQNRYRTNRAVAIMVWFGDKVMLTQRLKTSTFSGWWAAVGGSVEHNEEIIEAARRELFEETHLFILREQLMLTDCYREDEFKCFIFEVRLAAYLFSDVKNTEPDKHSSWQLFTVKEALTLPKLMPAICEILLRKR